MFFLIPGIGRADAPPVKVMPVGDSITYGIQDSPYYDGYRYPLYQQIVSQSQTVNFVGDLYVGSPSFTDAYNEGLPGYTCTQIQQYMSDHSSLSNFQPAVILLMCGTNSLDGYVAPTLDAQGALTVLSSFIDYLHAQSPTMRVVLGTIAPTTGNWNDQVSLYNAAMPGLVSQKDPSHQWLSFVDVGGTLNTGDLSSDGIHPSHSGYAKMATAWYPALAPFLSGTSSPPPTPSPVTNPNGGSYTGSVQVSLTDSNSQAVIYYSLSGTASTQSTVYSSPITLTQTNTLSVIAQAPGLAVSPVVSAAFTIQQAVASLTAGPSSFNFSGIQNGSNPNTQSLQINNVGSASMNWSADWSSTWLHAGVSSGTVAAASNQTITLSVNTAALSVGTYTDTVTITAPGAMGNPLTIPITLTVTTALQPPVCSAGSPTGTLSAGTSGATISLITDQSATCKYALQSGTAYASMTQSFTDTNGNLTHTAQASGFSNGQTYNYYVRCADNADATRVDTNDYVITFAVGNLSPATPSPVINPNGGAYTNSVQVSLTDSNSQAVIYYSLSGTASTLSTVYSGPLTLTQNKTLSVIAQAPGSTVSSVVSAAFTVQAAVASLSVGPSSFNFNGVQNGSNHNAQSLQINNVGSATMNWSAGSSSGWLHIATSSGAVAASSNQTISLYVDLTALSAGSYSGTVTITAPGATGSPATVPVTLTVVPIAQPPVCSAGSPIGTLSAGTSGAALSVTTDEAATCKYALQSGTAYATMSRSFSETNGNLTHTAQTSALSNGQTYNYYVRCVNSVDPTKVDTTDYLITFAVNSAANHPPTLGTLSVAPSDADLSTSGIQEFEGESLNFSAAVSDADNDALTWQWYYTLNGGARVASGNVGSANTAVSSFILPMNSEGDQYTWILHVSDGKSFSESSVGILVVSLPVSTTLPVPVFSESTTSVPATGNVTLTNISAYSNDSFVWNLTPLENSSGVSTPRFVRTSSGFPSLKTTTPTLNLSAWALTPGLYTLSVYAVDNTTNQVSRAVTTTIAITNDEISLSRVYPNPWRKDRNSGPVIFDQMPTNSTVKIFGVSGHLVRTLETSTGSVSWNLKNDQGDSVASGLYLYLIISGNDKLRGKLAVIK